MFPVLIPYRKDIFPRVKTWLYSCLRKEMIKRKGHYCGTEINEKWWKRYKKDGLFARGSGEYWFDSRSFCFRRYMTRSPIVFEYKNIRDIKKGKWHAGQWGAGRPILKIIWEKDGVLFSSGFLLSKSQEDTDKIIKDLRKYMQTDN